MAEFSENRHISNLINMSCKVSQFQECKDNIDFFDPNFKMFLEVFFGLTALQ